VFFRSSNFRLPSFSGIVTADLPFPSVFSMRLVQVAKALGMTGQQLRKELTSVDFGVKPTDREIPDNLAFGVIRFIARKHNIQVAPEVFTMTDGSDQDNPAAAAPAEEGEAGEAAPAAEKKPLTEMTPKADALHVLRKLSLEGVSAEAIAQQKQAAANRQEREAQQREEKAQSPVVRRRPGAESHQEQIKKKEGKVTLPDSISVKEFAEKTGIQVPKVIAALMKNGIMVTVTQAIDYDTAAIIAGDLGVEVEKEQGGAKAEDLLSKNLDELLKDEPQNLVARPL
jgi:hypothetical protein